MKKNSTILIMAIPIIVLLLGAVIYQYGYLRVQSDLTDMGDAVSVKSRILEKYVGLIADEPRLERQLAGLKEIRRTENAKVIEGQTAPLAAAALQSNITEMITSRGGSVSSERAEKTEEAGTFKMVTVAIDAVLPDIMVLEDALYAIEMQIPHLVVRELDVRIRNMKEPKDLTVRLKVSGLTRGM
jgi:hypothetical protein